MSDYIRFAPKGSKVDTSMLAVTMLLLGFGLLMLYSASYVVGIYRFGDGLHYIKDQVFFAGLGLIAMYAASWLDYRVLKKYSVWLMLLVYGLLVVVLFMPAYNGCHRWIVIPGFGTFQPSEVAKFAVILLFAHLIDQNQARLKTFRYGILPFGVVLVGIVGLMVLQPHLSGIIIICAIGAIMMFTGGSNIKYFIGVALVGAALLIAAIVIFPDLIHYASDRVYMWRHPEEDLLGKGYQSYQSLLAIGSGGLFGVGLGNGKAKHLHLPEPQNDFIFAVICEELGFVGGLMVATLFIWLFVRGFQLSRKAPDKFGAMLIVGVVTQIALQAVLNLAVATNTIPNTGISLPFFSEGGTSLMMILGEVGIVLSVSRYCDDKNIPNKK